MRSLLRTADPRLSVIVVDNDPVDERTAHSVRAVGDERVTYVREPRRGTSAGRNRGLVEAAARGSRYVAFVDDDVEVDSEWAGRVTAALEQGVACVCGPVLAAELATPAQLAADDALGWHTGFTRRRFSLAQPPPESAVFPFSPGLFGVGANLAVDVVAALDAGGFDPALGPGTPARAGEDCDFLVRLVLAGHTLAHERPRTCGTTTARRPRSWPASCTATRSGWAGSSPRSHSTPPPAWWRCAGSPPGCGGCARSATGKPRPAAPLRDPAGRWRWPPARRPTSAPAAGPGAADRTSPRRA
ncbi:hypothetical protein BJF78_27065 [Pseudonocardia sp. CNS-139]|nr:hypothetical protein BJF78_27065 [Pseudonocardia sp. CNS-139]